MKSKLSIIDIENNKNELSKILPSLNIDSIFLEQDVKQYANEIICFYSNNDPYVKYEVEKE